MDIHTDIAVIGGGLAGLTAAATVARGGAATLVLEAHRPGDTPGPPSVAGSSGTSAGTRSTSADRDRRHSPPWG